MRTIWTMAVGGGLLLGAGLHADTITGAAVGEGGAMLLFAEAELYDAAGTLQESAPIDFLSGTYSFTGLADGTWYVRVSAPLGSYLEEWYDDVAALSPDPLADGATPITVAGDIPVQGIDFVLSEGGSISGTVLAEAGPPVEFQSVEVYTAAGLLVDAVLTGFGGTYTVAGLKDGMYAVRTRLLAGSLADEWYLDVPAASDDPVADGAHTVAVSAGVDTPEIDFVLAAGGGMEGTLRGSGGGLAGESVEVTDSLGVVIASAVTDTGGLYRATGLAAGDYFVRSRVRGANYVDEWVGGVVAYTDPLADGAAVVQVTGGTTTTGTDLDLTPGGMVSGRADTLDGPLALQRIEMYRDNGSLFEVAITGLSGTYAVGGLPAGTYYLRTRALPAVYVDEWFQDVPAGDAGPVAAGATPVPVVAGMLAADIDFQIGLAQAPILSMSADGAGPALTWMALAGRTYQVARSTDAGAGAWSSAPAGTTEDEQSLRTAPADGPLAYVDTAPAAAARYRIELVP